MRPLLCLVLACTCTSAAATPLGSGQASELKSDIVGEYKLDTDGSVRLSLIDDNIYIDLNKRTRRQLLPVAPNLLASRDGALSVEYIPEGASERILIRRARLAGGRRIGEARWYGR